MTFAIRRWRPQARRQAIAPRFFDDEWFARPLRLAFHDSPGWLPPVDVEETDDAVVVRASVPGFRPDEIQITTADGDLIIQGAHEDEVRPSRSRTAATTSASGGQADSTAAFPCRCAPRPPARALATRTAF